MVRAFNPPSQSRMCTSSKAHARLREMTSDETTKAADLFGLPLTDFIASRDQLAETLRSEGNTEEAKTVARLRKPSVAAWALNQAVRHHPDALAELLASHTLLRQASSRETIEKASAQRNRAVARLTELAMAELESEAGRGSGQTRDRITRTLLAVATDSAGESDLTTGTLVREIDPSGSGWGDMAIPVVSQTPRSRSEEKAVVRARALAERLEAEAAAAEQRVEAAKEALDQARRRAKQARAAAGKAALEAEKAALDQET